jgi:hypothetical protein
MVEINQTSGFKPQGTAAGSLTAIATVLAFIVATVIVVGMVR